MSHLKIAGSILFLIASASSFASSAAGQVQCDLMVADNFTGKKLEEKTVTYQLGSWAGDNYVMGSPETGFNFQISDDRNGRVFMEIHVVKNGTHQAPTSRTIGTTPTSDLFLEFTYNARTLSANCRTM